MSFGCAFASSRLSIGQLQKRNHHLTIATLALSFLVTCLMVVITLRSDVIIIETPGQPSSEVIEKSSFDQRRQEALFFDITKTFVGINPSNYLYQEKKLEPYFFKKDFKNIERSITTRVDQLVAAKELGSYYFIPAKYVFDPITKKHFVTGDLHTVNVAKDTSQPWVVEYMAEFDSYHLWIKDMAMYEGKNIHDAEYEKANGKPSGIKPKHE